MALTKCCFCWNLKHGYLTYGILSMAGRLIVCLSLYYITMFLNGLSENSEYNQLVVLIICVYGGWAITSAVCLYFALKGIVQERSILLYPYLVVLVVEFFGFIVTGILTTIHGTPLNLIGVPFATVIRVYEFWCLINLYYDMQSNEIGRKVGSRISLKTV